jgi:hypothetical protein
MDGSVHAEARDERIEIELLLQGNVVTVKGRRLTVAAVIRVDETVSTIGPPENFERMEIATGSRVEDGPRPQNPLHGFRIEFRQADLPARGFLPIRQQNISHTHKFLQAETMDRKSGRRRQEP